VIEVDPKYNPIQTSDARYYIVTGGRGSGKSYSINLLLLLLTFEAGHTILFTGLHYLLHTFLLYQNL